MIGNSKAILLLGLLLAYSSQANWALLIVGSQGYDNYRHQADVCHAYQILIKGGIPASNIVVFSYDYLPNSDDNPVKGKLFNRPNGPDVYAGCKIDYRNIHVTPSNAIAVMTGDADAVKGKGTGRVLKSGPNDLVFINFVDHGSPGMLLFPMPFQSLHADTLQKTIQKMYDTKMYGKLVFYIEACESGSIFKKLPNNLNVYAVTAANATDPSYAAYCPPQDIVENNKHIGTCLGDLFSINWMENTDSVDTTQETLEAQYDVTRDKTTQSQVLQFGDLSIATLPVSDFLGAQTPATKESKDYRYKSQWRVWDNKLNFLITQHSRKMTVQSMQALNKEILIRRTYDQVFGIITSAFPIETAVDADDTDFDCYRSITSEFYVNCGDITNYGMRYMRTLYNLCSGEFDKQLFSKKIHEACPEILFPAEYPPVPEFSS